MVNNRLIKHSFSLSLAIFTCFFVPKTIFATADSQLWIENPTSSTLKVYLNTNSNQAVGAEIHLQFDPQFIKINSITPDTFFANPNVTDYQIDNNSGNTFITLLGSPSRPQTGSGSLVNLDFSTLKTGTTKINLTDSTKIAALGEAGNSLKDKQDLSFEITKITADTTAFSTPTIILRQTLTPSPEPLTTISQIETSTLAIISQPQTLIFIGICLVLIIFVFFLGLRQIKKNSFN